MNTRLAHHALRLTALLVPPAIAALALQPVSGWYTALFVVLALLALVIGLYSNAHRVGYCPHCPTRTPADLKRLRFRLVPAFMWTAGTVLVAFFLLTAALPAIWPTDGNDNKPPTLTGLAKVVTIMTALCWLGLGAIAAARFRKAHKEHYGSGKEAPLAVLRLIHKGHWVVFAAAVAAVTVRLLSTGRGVWESAEMVTMGLLVVAFLLEDRHGRKLCEECVTEFLPDAAERAEKRKWVFTLHHRVVGWVVPIGLISVMAAAVTSMPHIWQQVFFTAYYGPVVGISFIMWFHGRYMPWCPYCRRWGRGGDPAQVPDPAGGDRKPVPA